MKMGYLTATTFAALALGTGVFTAAIAFSAEERVKAERVFDKLEKSADKLEARQEKEADKLEAWQEKVWLFFVLAIESLSGLKRWPNKFSNRRIYLLSSSKPLIAQLVAERQEVRNYCISNFLTL